MGICATVLMKRTLSLFISLYLLFSLFSSITISAESLPNLNDAYQASQGSSPGSSDNQVRLKFNEYVLPLFDDDTIGTAVAGRVLTSVEAAANRVATVDIGADRQTSLNKSLNSLYTKVRNATTIVMVFGILTSVLVALWNFFKIAFMPSHPMQRRTALESIVTSSVVAILLAGLTLIMNILIGTFQGSFASAMIYATDWRVAGVVFLAQYRDIIVGVFGIITMSMVLALSWQFMNLVLAGGNPQKRTQAITGILITAAATAGVGGIMTVMSLLTGLVGA